MHLNNIPSFSLVFAAQNKTVLQQEPFHEVKTEDEELEIGVLILSIDKKVVAQ